MKFFFLNCFLLSSLVFAATEELSLEDSMMVNETAEVRETVEQKPEKNKGVEIKKIPHPGAAKGLIRINKDGSYQYKIKTRPKDQSATVRLTTMTSPKIENTTRNLNFTDMYGSNPWALLFDYEWQPFKKFGTLGLQLGTGVSVFSGKGRLVSQGVDLTSEERFNLFVVPLSAFIDYRFEYSRKQWLVPYIVGGGTLYMLAEKRDDKNNFDFATSFAAGGGGGIHFSVTRWDHQVAFNMDRDYGVSDMWLTLDARVMQGLKAELDFSSLTIGAGITVDY